MSDSSDVDAAVSATLVNDATLTTLMPGGVYFDAAKAGVTKFIIIAQEAHEEDYEFPGRTAWERFEYLVKAVALSTTGADVRTAAARIHTVMLGGTIAPTGYQVIRIARLERVRYTEVDQDNDQRWQHRGGRYEVLVHPL